MHGHRLALDVPVDQHPAAVIARVPLGEPVLIKRADVRGVRRNRGRAGAPQAVAARGKGRVGDLHRDRAGSVDGEIAAADVADLVIGVAVRFGR